MFMALFFLLFDFVIKKMNKYIFYIILISNFSFSQERRITRQANSYIIENKDSISMDKVGKKYNNAIKLNDNFNS